MKRIALSGLVAIALLALPATAAAAPKAGCAAAASGWHLSTPLAAATGFFPHLTPGQFATAAEFAAVIDAAVDRNDDDLICIRFSWGYALNPKSHWYVLGFDLGLGEPVHVMQAEGNNANAT
jgi:hypothetical protein